MDEEYGDIDGSYDGPALTYTNISSQVFELLHYEIMFSLDERRHGAVIIHLLICLYAFAALAILCDDYFCAALNKICKRLNIHPDVAGATFMAAGSSMPTMFISVTSVILDEGDIGLGTIIGSTMFNILFITGVCGLATSVAINLKPYSIIRDSFCYVIYLIILLLTMFDGMIYWYEACIVSSLYGVYVIIMYYNSSLEHHFNRWARAHFHQTRSGTPGRSPAKSHSRSPVKSSSKSPTKTHANSPTINGNPDIEVTEPPEDTDQGALPEKRAASPELSSQPDNHSTMPNEQPALPEEIAGTDATTSHTSNDIPISSSLLHASNLDEAMTEGYDDRMSDVHSVYSDTDDTLPHTKYDDEPFNALAFPSGRWEAVRFAIMFPIRFLYYITIPDCRVASWESWYIVTFVMSIVWMGLHSYVLVWAVSVIGVTIGIPECIMGLTLLAAGSSIPDAIASLVMAEQGLGDMALANAIGSNIFDMLCLSIPWLLSTTIVHPNSQVLIQGGNIVYVSMTLFGTVALALAILYYNEWRLDRKLGAAMMTSYLFFLSAAVLIESFPSHKKITHPLHRPDLPHQGLGTSESHRVKNKIKSTGFTWN
ncbi:sodium/potassium/calcium exchanger 5-like [Dendronephthya gigantea]|uniref:sodium/potassium/calcium exchanger 5-like n=1 Tax=Dendronephthya gigantea TaxID=151771 RepID=UPI00106B8AAE|nr:sodium/potassium/calcium exchanger 5-like [Dendronephthya gigantea]